MGYIDMAQFAGLADALKNSSYGQYLQYVMRGFQR